MNKIVFLVVLLGYLVTDGAMARVSHWRSIAKSTRSLTETIHGYRSLAELHLMLTQQNLFMVKLTQFKNNETTQASTDLRQELIDLYDEIQHFHHTYSNRQPEKHWYDPQLFTNLELWLEKMGHHLELVFSWKDGDREKAIELLLITADKGWASFSVEDVNNVVTPEK